MIHLVTGGARSGKSRFVLGATEVLLEPEAPIGFIATAKALDEEMAFRIKRHRAERSARYLTLEEPINLVGVLSFGYPVDAWIVDCLTVWTANLMFQPGATDETVEAAFAGLFEGLQRARKPVFLVTNEVGMGIVPEHPLSRRYRDHLGRLNQGVAQVADAVTLLVCGIPMRVK